MVLKFNYTVKLGKYDGNDDVFEREISSTDKTLEEAYKKAGMIGPDFEDVPEFQPLREQVYREIEREEIEKLKEEGDDYFANECLKKGQSPFDNGYKIEVFYPYEEIIPEDEETEEYLREALADQDIELAEAIVMEQYGNYSGNLLEKSFEIAEEVGCQAFIDKNKRE